MIYQSWSNYKDELLQDQGSLYMGDMRNVSPHHTKDADDLYMPELLSGSDYSGGSVTESNFRVFKELYVGDDKLIGIWEVYGGYGTYGIAISRELMTTTIVQLHALRNETYNKYADLKGEYTGENKHLEMWIEMRECLDNLENYPVIDEDDMSQLELEQQGEAYESWGRSDFKRELLKHFQDSDLYGPLEDWLDCQTANDEIDQLFYKLESESNTYWEDQSGAGQWIDVEKIAQTANERDIVELLDPLERIPQEQMRLPDC